MDKPLRNVRREKFVQAIFEGRSAVDACEVAGYKRFRQSAWKLLQKADIRLRLAELQEQAAKDSAVTVESLLRELEEARSKASNLDQLSAAVRAIEAKARISGLMTQKVEVSISAIERATTVEQVVDAVLAECGASYTSQDREVLSDMLQRHATELNEFVASLRAIRISNSPTDQRDREAQRERKALLAASRGRA